MLHGENFSPSKACLSMRENSTSFAARTMERKTFVGRWERVRPVFGARGKYPVVIISPQDINLIWEGGEGRRRFFDQWLSQSNRHYLENLVINFETTHKFAQTNPARWRIGRSIAGLLSPADDSGCDSITSDAQKFIDEINPALADEYAALVKAKEQVRWLHTSDLDNASAEAVLMKNLSQEIAAGEHWVEFT